MYSLFLSCADSLVVLFEGGDFCSTHATERACLKYVRSEVQGDSLTGSEDYEYNFFLELENVLEL